MATSDFEEDEVYEEDDGGIGQDIQDIKDSGKNLKDTIKDGPSKDADKAKETRKFNEQLRNKNKARASNGEIGKQAGKETAKKAGQESAKKAGQEAGKQVAKEAGKQVAKEGAKAGAKTAVKAVPYVGWAIAIADAAIKLLKAIKKLQNRIDSKAAESGIDLKSIRRLIAASPLIAIFAIIIIILLIIVLLTQTRTIEKTDALKQAIECAESSGCTDFMNTGVTISSASVPLGGIGGTIVAFTGEQLSAAEQSKNSKFLTTLNKTFEEITSKKLIYFTDLQIARLVIEYLMFENKYYGFTDTLNKVITDMTKNLNGAEGEEKSVIEWLFQMLVDHTIIGDIYEAYSLFNWLKLEKVAFNKIEWKIIHTGVSGTGLNFLDDTLNNFCKDTEDWWRTDALKKFCNESKETESLTFKVVGDFNPFTSMLWVPTDLWSLGDAAINAADVFGITDKLSILQNWKASSLPDQETLVNAVYEYLPTWVEIYSVYVNCSDLDVANDVYNYYVKNLGSGGDFEIKVSLYALRNYEITRTTDFGEQTTYYNIYDKDDNLIEYEDNNGNTKKTSKLTETQMKEFVNDKKIETTKTEGGEECTDADYESGVCIRPVTTYKKTTCASNGRHCTEKKVNCTDDDYNSNSHGCTKGTTTTPIVEVKETFWEKLKSFAKGLEEKLRSLWAGVKVKLASGWYYASNFVKDYLYTKYPLSLASERRWTISVTKGTTFDSRYEWGYSVSTNKTVENVTGDASEGFSNDKSFENTNNHSVSNSSKIDNSKVISKTTVAKTDDLIVKQITEYINIEKEVTTWDERLDMISSKTEEYVLKKKRKDENGKDIYDEVEYDNRLAYVIELIANDGENIYNSDDFAAAYEAIRSYKGESYNYSGIYTDYSNLTDGAFGWPMETINNPSLSSCTGIRGNVFGGSGTETHGGDDIPAPEGTKILAAKDGEIILNQYNNGGYGYYVIIKHSDGWYTLYGHMVRQSTLAVGTKVTAGQVIGYVGTTGRSTGNHLHFEIRYGTTGGFWSAEKKEPILYVSKETIPEGLYASASNCPDKSTWGI